MKKMCRWRLGHGKIRRMRKRGFIPSGEPELVSPQFALDNTCYHNFWNHENQFSVVTLVKFRWSKRDVEDKAEG